MLDSADMLETLMGNLPGMAYRCRLDTKWTMEFVSEGAQALTGYDPQEIIHNRVVSYGQLLNPQDQEHVRAEILQAVAYDQKFQVSYRILTRDGLEKWVWEQGCAVVRNGRELLEGFIIDISQLKEAEAAAHTNADRANSLLTAASRLNAQLDLRHVLSAVCEEAARVNAAPATAMFVFHPERNGFIVEAVYGLSTQQLEQFRPISRDIYEHYARQFTFPYYLQDLTSNPAVANREFYKSEGLNSALIAPVERDNTLIGLLVAFFRDSSQSIHREKIDLIQGYAHLAAQAISNAQLYDESRTRLRRLQALRAIDGAIVGRHHLQDALSIVVEQVKEQLEVDAVCIFLYSPSEKRLRFTAGAGFHTDLSRNTVFKVGEDIIGRAALHNHLSLALPDVDEPFGVRLLADEGFSSFLGVRLGLEDRLTGVLCLFQRTAVSHNEEWLAFVESLAIQSAIAIDNANLLAQTRRLLRRTQMQANQIRQIVDSVPEGVILLGGDLRVILANVAGAEYLKLLCNAGVGDRIETLAETPLSTLLSTVAPQNVWQELRSEQLRRTFEVAFGRLQEGPQEDGWVMVISDVTEERERQKRQQMQERLATVGQLAAGIAHDFNNSLGVITLYSEMLLATLALDDSPRKRLAVINEQAQQASALVRQILDFSRQSILERRPVELQAFLKDVVDLLRRTLPESIVVEFNIDESQSYIANVDLPRLQQALMNLAVNARDAMPRGGRLTIAMRSEHFEEEATPLPDMSPGTWLTISVADSGSGIAARNLPHIFEPFFSTKPRGEGTGLGLAQVYGLIRQHEGFIDVSSTVGQGSIFSIYLPTPVTSSETPKPGADTHLLEGQEQTILIVEDNPIIQQALKDMLQLLNYRVLLASDGEQALRLLRDPRVDVSLVISDLVMPRMGGATLHSRMQQHHPDIKMIVMTGYPLESQNRDLLEYRDLYWVQKPFSMDKMAETVYRALHDD